MVKEYAYTVQDSTYNKTEKNIKNHIHPVWNQKQLLSPLQLQEQINEWPRNYMGAEGSDE